MRDIHHLNERNEYLGREVVRLTNENVFFKMSMESAQSHLKALKVKLKAKEEALLNYNRAFVSKPCLIGCAPVQIDIYPQDEEAA